MKKAKPKVCKFCGEPAETKGHRGLCKPCYDADILTEANIREVIRKYGKKRASTANIGWGQDDDLIETKVYGVPCMVVATRRIRCGGKRPKFSHEHFVRDIVRGRPVYTEA